MTANADDMKALCKTLRDGFGHFRYRYADRTPTEYFRRMGLPLPTTVVAKPDLAHNYKVFVCDWKLKKGNFGDPNTDSRLVGTHFPHLRYHLFRFLALFFSDSDRKPSYDIILRGDVT